MPIISLCTVVPEVDELMEVNVVSLGLSPVDDGDILDS